MWQLVLTQNSMCFLQSAWGHTSTSGQRTGSRDDVCHLLAQAVKSRVPPPSLAFSHAVTWLLRRPWFQDRAASRWRRNAQPRFNLSEKKPFLGGEPLRFEGCTCYSSIAYHVLINTGGEPGLEMSQAGEKGPS